MRQAPSNLSHDAVAPRYLGNVGITLRLKVKFTTVANDAYQAASAVNNPT